MYCRVFFSKFMITMKYLDERVFFAYAFCTGNKVSVAFCRFKIYKICNLILKNNHVFVWFELPYFTMRNVMKKKWADFHWSWKQITSPYVHEYTVFSGNAFLIQFDYLQIFICTMIMKCRDLFLAKSIHIWLKTVCY